LSSTEPGLPADSFFYTAHIDDPVGLPQCAFWRLSAISGRVFRRYPVYIQFVARNKYFYSVSV